MSDQPTPRPGRIIYDDTVIVEDEDGNVVPHLVYSSIPGRAPYLDPGLPSRKQREAVPDARPGVAGGQVDGSDG
jgi:hypothetical protein